MSISSSTPAHLSTPVQQGFAATNGSDHAEPLPGRPVPTICTHIKIDGIRCGSPAVKGTALCFHHSALKTALGKVVRPTEYQEYPPIQFLYPEDRASVQINYFLLLQAISEDRVEPRKARVLFQLLRAMATNLGKMSLDESAVTAEASQQEPMSQNRDMGHAQQKPFVSANAAKAAVPPHPARVVKQSVNPALNIAASAFTTTPAPGYRSLDEAVEAIAKMKFDYFPCSAGLL